MKKGGRVILVIFVSLLGVIAAVLGAVAIILSPARLTDLVNRYADRYLDASVSVSAASVHVLKNFPDISVILNDGSIVVPAPEGTDKWADSLLVFRKMEVTLRPAALLHRMINIPGISMEHASIHLFTDRKDRSNWDIFRNTGDTRSPGYGFSFGKLSATDTLHFTYHDYRDTVYYSVSIEKMTAAIPFRGTGYKADIHSFSNTLIVGEKTLFDKIPFMVKGGITLENNFDDYYFQDCETVLGDVPLYINGFMGLREDSLELRGICRIDSTRFDQLYAAIPRNLLPAETPVESFMAVKDLEVILNGAYYYDSGQFPVYSARITAGPGLVTYLPADITLPEFKAVLSSSYDPGKGDFGTISVNRLEAEGPALELSLQGVLSSFFKDPEVRVSADMNVRLDRLSTLVGGMESHNAEGHVAVDLEADFRLKDLDPAGLGNVMLSAHLQTNGFTLDLPADSIFCRADTTRIQLGITPGTALDLDLVSDSLNIRFKGRELATLSETMLKAGSTPGMFTRDTTRVNPLHGTLKSKSLRLFLNDTTRIRIQRADMNFSIMPDPQDPAIPLIEATLQARSAGGTYGVHRARINNLHFRADLTHNLRTRRRDTTSLRRDRTHTQHEFSYADLDFDIDRETRGLLRKWDVNGSLQASGMQVVTPVFPLRTRILSLHMGLRDDRLEITDTQIRAGRSDLLLNGYVTNIRRVLMGRGRLGLNFDLQSDTLDSNELIQAIHAGASFLNRLDSTEMDLLKEEILHAGSEEQLETMISEKVGQGEAYDNLLIVPGNVDLQVVLAVSNAYYRHLEMQGLHGMLRAADRYLQLDELQASSNAGDIRINALYATPSVNDLSVGLDMEMHDILLEEVTRLLPSMDTLFPMISSFRGLADIQISATSQLDTGMNLVLSSLTGACRIKGDGLVLLDGETFSEISRKLMFRKKALNLIDSIRVEATVANNRVDVFPFIMEMDRYRAAIAGSHHMDKSFHYHISILRSPVPFRFGLDVHGTPEDFEIDLGRMRFSDQGIPALSYRIDSIRVNLKESIRRYFNHYTFE